MRNLRHREFQVWPSSLSLSRCLLASFAHPSVSEGLWHVLQASHSDCPCLTSVLTMARPHPDASTSAELSQPYVMGDGKASLPRRRLGEVTLPLNQGSAWKSIHTSPRCCRLHAAHSQESFPLWFGFRPTAPPAYLSHAWSAVGHCYCHVCLWPGSSSRERLSLWGSWSRCLVLLSTLPCWCVLLLTCGGDPPLCCLSMSGQVRWAASWANRVPFLFVLENNTCCGEVRFSRINVHALFLGIDRSV